MPDEQSISIAIIDHDKEFLENSLALLRKESDIRVCTSHLLISFVKESSIADAATEDVSHSQPRVLLLSQMVIREAAAKDLKSILKIRDKNSNMHIVIIVDQLCRRIGADRNP
ncbi:MAG: hypothetical protein ABSB79_13340 [Syntrophales bacterium]|jgi:hypothetical protein